jgi:hypothetical protein
MAKLTKSEKQHILLYSRGKISEAKKMIYLFREFERVSSERNGSLTKEEVKYLYELKLSGRI